MIPIFVNNCFTSIFSLIKLLGFASKNCREGKSEWDCRWNTNGHDLTIVEAGWWECKSSWYSFFIMFKVLHSKMLSKKYYFLITLFHVDQFVPWFPFLQLLHPKPWLKYTPYWSWRGSHQAVIQCIGPPSGAQMME